MRISTLANKLSSATYTVLECCQSSVESYFSLYSFKKSRIMCQDIPKTSFGGGGGGGGYKNLIYNSSISYNDNSM